MPFQSHPLNKEDLHVKTSVPTSVLVGQYKQRILLNIGH